MNISTFDENTGHNWSINTPECCHESQEVQFVQINFIVALAFSLFDVLGIILGSLANIVMISLVLNQSELRKTTDVFTSSLCVSDLLASVLFQPFVIRRLLARKPNQSFEWAVRRTIGQTTMLASSTSLLTATLDRYIVLRWPLHYQNIISKRTTYLIVSSIWLVSCIIGATAYFKRNLSTVVFPCVLAIIVASIIATQLAIFIIAKKQVQKIWKHTRPSDEGKKFLSCMRATKTVTLLLAVFLVSWLPSTIFRFYDVFTGGNIVTFHKWMHVLNTLIQIHCSLDPFLYVLRNQRFKKAIAKVINRHIHIASINRWYIKQL